MRRHVWGMGWVVLAPWCVLSCNGFPSPGVRGPSPEPPAAEEPRRQVADRDGNDSWDAAGQMTVNPTELLVVTGQLGAVDSSGVLDQVDYFRFRARHRSLLLLVEGKVEVDLVTASDQPVTPAAIQPRWYDPLSLDGGYALRVRPQVGQAEAYRLTLIAGANAGADCDEGCRWGLWCIDGRCSQDSQPGEACVDAGDCLAGQCVDGVCSADDDVCAADTSPIEGCRGCASADDCQYGDCQYNICVYDGYCEPATGASSDQRCRAGLVQVCSAGAWRDVGHCDTGCWGDQCAPAPDQP